MSNHELGSAKEMMMSPDVYTQYALNLSKIGSLRMQADWLLLLAHQESSRDDEARNPDLLLRNEKNRRNATLILHNWDSILEAHGHREIDRSPLLAERMGKIIGKIITGTGADYLEVRRDIHDSLDHRTIGEYVSIVETKTRHALALWDQQSQSPESFDLQEMNAHLFREIVPATLLGGYTASPELINAIENTLTLMNQGNPGFMDAAKETIPLFKNFLEEVKGVAEQGEKLGAQKNLGLLRTVLENYRNGNWTIEQAFAEFVGLYTAAFDTTANVLSWSEVETAVRPDVWKKLRTEALAVLPEEGQPITHEMVQKLTYALQCVKEAERLHPALAAMTRQVSHQLPEDLEFEGVKVPAETVVYSMVEVAMRDVRLWGNDANDYVPERMAQLTNDQKKAMTIPWEGKKHLCPGMPLAQMEAALILAMIAQHYDVINTLFEGPVEQTYVPTNGPRGLKGMFQLVPATPKTA
jgi:cytochrome P450